MDSGSGIADCPNSERIITLMPTLTTKLYVYVQFGYRGRSVWAGESIEWDNAVDGETMATFVELGLAGYVPIVQRVGND